VAEEEHKEPDELTPEELLEHIRRMKVSDLLLSTVTTVAQLGYAKLASSFRSSRARCPKRSCATSRR
jgi:hypothetical protein